jgi:1-acyl-sn-glycerol-3-phosphate acyltransferase
VAADERQDCFAWRLFGTGLSFALFGLVGILLGGVFFPLSRLVPLSPETRRAFGSRIVVGCFHGFARFISGIGAISYEFHGRERLGRPGQLILANHPSLIDVVFLIGHTPRAGCVVKAELWRNPFTGGVVSSAGYVPNAPTDAMIEGASAALAAGQPLIMFPEGTRTRPGQPIVFHRGAAAVAIRAASVITPVYITVSPTTLTKNEPWHRIPNRRAHWRLIVGDDIDPAPFRAGRAAPQAARALNSHLIAEFGRHLASLPNTASPRKFV